MTPPSWLHRMLFTKLGPISQKYQVFVQSQEEKREAAHTIMIYCLKADRLIDEVEQRHIIQSFLEELHSRGINASIVEATYRNV